MTALIGVASQCLHSRTFFRPSSPISGPSQRKEILPFVPPVIPPRYSPPSLSRAFRVHVVQQDSFTSVPIGARQCANRALRAINRADFLVAVGSPPTRQVLVGKQRHAPPARLILPESFLRLWRHHVVPSAGTTLHWMAAYRYTASRN